MQQAPVPDFWQTARPTARQIDPLWVSGDRKKWEAINFAFFSMTSNEYAQPVL